MKKFFLIAASAMMVLASCTKVVINYPEDAQPQEIAMFAVNKSATKAPVEGTVFPTTYNMMVSAYLVSGTTNTTTNTTPGEYFNQKRFTKPEGATTWTGGQYWPISAATINFFAVAPEVAATQGGIATQIDAYDAEAEEPKKTAETTVSGNSVNQYDVMYALAQGSYKGDGDYNEVNMTFNHALSWINFQVRKGISGDGAPEIVVNWITLNNVYFDGKATITASDYTKQVSPANSATTVTWDTKDISPLSVALPETSAYVGEATDYSLTLDDEYASFAKDGLLVIPHKYESTDDGNEPSFTINYTVTQDNKSFIYDYTYTFTNGVTWEVGKKYVYKVSITLHKIEVKPSVGDWGDPVEEEIKADEKVDNTPAEENTTA